jgi:hypothetical protein
MLPERSRYKRFLPWAFRFAIIMVGQPEVIRFICHALRLPYKIVFPSTTTAT